VLGARRQVSSADQQNVENYADSYNKRQFGQIDVQPWSGRLNTRRQAALDGITSTVYKRSGPKASGA